MISATPSSAVESDSPTSVVATIASGWSSFIASAMSPLIFERKISPASCTWPIAKSRLDEAEKAIWWTVDEKMTSFTSREYICASAWKAGWRKMIAAKPIITGATTTALISPYTAAFPCVASADSRCGSLSWPLLSDSSQPRAALSSSGAPSSGGKLRAVGLPRGDSGAACGEGRPR